MNAQQRIANLLFISILITLASDSFLSLIHCNHSNVKKSSISWSVELPTVISTTSSPLNQPTGTASSDQQQQDYSYALKSPLYDTIVTPSRYDDNILSSRLDNLSSITNWPNPPTQHHQQAVEIASLLTNNYITSDLISKALNLKQSTKSSTPKSFWFKPPLGANPIATTKRRSLDSQTSLNDFNGEIVSRMAKVKFDDSNNDELSFGSQKSSKDSKDYLNTLPLIYDSLASSSKMEPNSVSGNQDSISSIMDNLIAASKYSMSHTMTPHHQYSPFPATYYYPATTAYKFGMAPRKSIEKSLGYPILIGVGAALISFLILSNLFLSIPLFAMTLLQFLNGNNMLMPNGNNNPSNNNSNGQTSSGRRKRRDLKELELEEMITSAINQNFD